MPSALTSYALMPYVSSIIYRLSSIVHLLIIGRNIMSSTAQIQANRQNAQKSTGPTSIEGKAISAKNAVKHGLFSIETVIKGENWEDFNLFREKLLDEFAPEGAVEVMLAERIVSIGWRLKRIVRIQDQVFDVMIEKDEPSPYQKQLNSMMPQAMRDDLRGAGPELVLGRAVISDFSNSRVLERLLMYERRLERSLNKTMDELHKRKLIRQLEQANKEIEAEEFEMDGTSTTEEVNVPGFVELRRGEKNEKQSQFYEDPRHQTQGSRPEFKKTKTSF
jgi:hypothetical protein